MNLDSFGYKRTEQMAVIDQILDRITHDKKASNQNCSVVYVSEIGNGSIEEWSMDAVLDRLECN